MKKAFLVLLCFLMLNNAFASANRDFNESKRNDKNFIRALGFLVSAINLDRTVDQRSASEKKLVEEYNEIPSYRESVAEAYDFIIKKESERKQSKDKGKFTNISLDELGRIKVRLGIK